MKRIRFFLLVSVFLVSGLALFAQENILAIQLDCGKTSKFRRTDTISLTIHFNVAEGFYVFATSDPFGAMPAEGIAIEFEEWPVGIKVGGDTEWSAASLYNGTEVYRGKQHTARQLLVVTNACRPGSYLLRGNISFQACNADMCYPPQTISFEKEIIIRK